MACVKRKTPPLPAQQRLASSSSTSTLVPRLRPGLYVPSCALNSFIRKEEERGCCAGASLPTTCPSHLMHAISSAIVPFRAIPPLLPLHSVPPLIHAIEEGGGDILPLPLTGEENITAASQRQTPTYAAAGRPAPHSVYGTRTRKDAPSACSGRGSRAAPARRTLNETAARTTRAVARTRGRERGCARHSYERTTTVR